MSRKFFIFWFFLFAFNIYGEKKSILVSSAPLASLVSLIVGDSADIHVLKNSSGCVHNIHFKPQDISLASSVDLIIYSSKKSEEMIDKLPNPRKFAVMGSSPVVNLWLDPFGSTIDALSKICDKLQEFIPEKKAIYKENYIQAIRKFQKLEGEIKKIADKSNNKSTTLIILEKDKIQDLFDYLKIKYIYQNPANMKHIDNILSFLEGNNYKLIITEHYNSHKITQMVNKEKMVKINTENWMFNSAEELKSLYFKQIMGIIERLYE